MSEHKVYRPDPIQYDDGLETNIYGIAEQICSRPPQPPCTIQLIIDHDVERTENLDDYEFDLLRTFTMACLSLKFGKNVNPMKLSDEDLSIINQYINSIGYRMKTDIEETESSYKFMLSFSRYGQSAETKNPLEYLKKYVPPS